MGSWRKRSFSSEVALLPRSFVLIQCWTGWVQTGEDGVWEDGFYPWLEWGQVCAANCKSNSPYLLLSSTNSTQSIFTFTSLIWALKPPTWSLNDTSSCFCSAFFLVPFNNSYSSTTHSPAPSHCSFGKQQDMKGTGDAEIWPWLQTLLTLEGNNSITAWSLIACLGNIQAAPYTEMCGASEGEKGPLCLQYFFMHSSQNFRSSF